MSPGTSTGQCGMTLHLGRLMPVAMMWCDCRLFCAAARRAVPVGHVEYCDQARRLCWLYALDCALQGFAPPRGTIAAHDLGPLSVSVSVSSGRVPFPADAVAQASMRFCSSIRRLAARAACSKASTSFSAASTSGCWKSHAKTRSPSRSLPWARLPQGAAAATRPCFSVFACKNRVRCHEPWLCGEDEMRDDSPA